MIQRPMPYAEFDTAVKEIADTLLASLGEHGFLDAQGHMPNMWKPGEEMARYIRQWLSWGLTYEREGDGLPLPPQPAELQTYAAHGNNTSDIQYWVAGDMTERYAPLFDGMDNIQVRDILVAAQVINPDDTNTIVAPEELCFYIYFKEKLAGDRFMARLAVYVEAKKEAMRKARNT